MIGWTLPTYSSVFRDEAPESPIPWLNAGFLLERPGGLKVLGHGNQQKWNVLRPYPALATRRWSSKRMRIRSGLFCGSIYWVLLVSGRVSVPKPLSQIQRSTV